MVDNAADSDGDVLHYHHLVPIGGIIPWAKTLTDVPALGESWIECDGSVVSDANSPINGQTVPDLNGDNRFLRGDSTSGGTGGAETHTHATLGPAVNGKFLYTQSGSGGDSTTGAGSSLPTYYGVVWIIRIK